MAKGPNGLTHRQERFCRAFVEHGSASTAAFAAKYAPQWTGQHGYRLLKQPRIRARIAEIQAEMAEEACRDTEVLLGKLEAVYRRALENHHFHAAARAIDLQNRMRAEHARELRAAAREAAPLPAPDPASPGAASPEASAPTAQRTDSKLEIRKMYSFD